MPNSKTSKIHLGELEVIVQQKEIKNLHLSVMPPNGWVRVSAPFRMRTDEIRQMLALKLPWIKQQQQKYHQQARQTQREYISGESFYFFGEKYRLEVRYLAETPKVFLQGKTKLILQVRPNSSAEKRQEILEHWYREGLRKILTKIIDEWQEKMAVKFTAWKIKQMRTRWGTCNAKSKTALFNLELAKKPIVCLDYVVVHELAHLIERTHNDKFKKTMDVFLPKWRSIKDDLNRFILDYQDWNQQKDHPLTSLN